MSSTSTTSQPLTSSRCGPLTGHVKPPGDKSLSHRAVMLGGIAQGVTHVRGLLEGQDVMASMAALRAMGAGFSKEGDVWRIEGVGAKGLSEPACVLDMGNSGTSARLLIGLLGARASMTAFFTGDASLCKRPMGRVIEPLEQMGAQFLARSGGRFPLGLRGPETAKAIDYRLPVASAQVKSAVLLAGLSARGVTRVIETIPTRDHSERMLRGFGVRVDIEKTAEGEVISLEGGQGLIGQEIEVPGDISSAAFPMVAAAIKEGSDVLISSVGLNERRAGIVQSLLEMGADLRIEEERLVCGEKVASVRVRGGVLKGARIPAARAPSMIDEYPVLAMAAACAEGTSRFEGLGELRVKESDRLALVAQGLEAAGVKVEIEGDDLIIHGCGRPPAGGVRIEAALDHRIAMSFLVLGTASRAPISIDDGSVMETSFPGFVALMNGLGTKIGPAGG